MVKRIKYIDRIKGLAILLVVIAHIYLFSNNGESFVYKIIKSFHMPLFMFISGYVAFIDKKKYNPKQVKKKLTKRLFTYLCPAIMIGLIITFFRLIIMKDNSISIFHAIEGRAMTVTTYWYLKVLVSIVVIQFLIIIQSSAWRELLIVVFFLLLSFAGWKFSPILNSILCLEHIVCFAPFFYIGYYSRKYKIQSIIFNKNWIFTLCIVCFICLFYATIPFKIINLIIHRFFIPLLAIYIIVFLFYQREEKENRIEKWIAFVGTKTLDIYIYHCFFILSLPVIDYTILNTSTFLQNNPILLTTIILLFSIILSYISIWIGYIIKQSKFLSKIIYGIFSTDTKVTPQ